MHRAELLYMIRYYSKTLFLHFKVHRLCSVICSFKISASRARQNSLLGLRVDRIGPDWIEIRRFRDLPDHDPDPSAGYPRMPGGSAGSSSYDIILKGGRVFGLSIRRKSSRQLGHRPLGLRGPPTPRLNESRLETEDPGDVSGQHLISPSPHVQVRMSWGRISSVLMNRKRIF